MADLATADHLVEAATGTPVVVVRTSIPESVAGSGFEIQFVSKPTSDPGDHLYRVNVTLESGTLDISRTTSLQTRLKVTNTTVTGGNYVIAYDTSADRLEVRSDG